MTNKIQFSKKFPDGTIIVVGGDNVKEFTKLYTEFRETEVAKNIFQEVVKPVETPQQPSAPQGNATGKTVVLPPDAMLEVTRKGGKVHGDISPFPGTKFAVRVWPEVMETIQGFNDDVWEMPLGGRTVMYVENEKGYPQKVTAIK